MPDYFKMSFKNNVFSVEQISKEEAQKLEDKPEEGVEIVQSYGFEDAIKCAMEDFDII